jgi:hypothetical protein
MTQENSYTTTNIEQVRHKSKSSANQRYARLKKYVDEPVWVIASYAAPPDNRANYIVVTATFLQLILWNVNGLERLKPFISIHNRYVLLTSGTHFAEKIRLKLSKYACHTNHQAANAQGGIALVIKICIRHQVAWSIFLYKNAQNPFATTRYKYARTSDSLYLK